LADALRQVLSVGLRNLKILRQLACAFGLRHQIVLKAAVGDPQQRDDDIRIGLSA